MSAHPGCSNIALNGQTVKQKQPTWASVDGWRSTAWHTCAGAVETIRPAKEERADPRCSVDLSNTMLGQQTQRPRPLIPLMEQRQRDWWCQGLEDRGCGCTCCGGGENVLELEVGAALHCGCPKRPWIDVLLPWPPWPPCRPLPVLARALLDPVPQPLLPHLLQAGSPLSAAPEPPRPCPQGPPWLHPVATSGSPPPAGRGSHLVLGKGPRVRRAGLGSPTSCP